MLFNALWFTVCITWCFVVTLSGIGYAQGLAFCFNSIFGRRAFFLPTPLSIKFAIGFSILITIGGALSFLNFMSKFTAISLICVGVTLYFICNTKADMLKKIRPNKEWYFWLAGFYWFSYVLYREFNIHDDFHAYLTYPKIILETGGLNFLSFSERGLYSLGGNSVAKALFLSTLPLHLIHAFEALCAVLSLHYAWDLSKSFSVNLKLRLCIIITITMMASHSSNISSLYSSSLWILALFHIIFSFLKYKNWLDPLRWDFVITVSLLSVALASQKQTYIPFLGLIFFLICSIVWLNRKFWISLKFSLTYFLTSLLLMLPWLFSSLNNYDTLLYPILGKGNHRTAYTDQASLAWDPSLYEVQKLAAKNPFYVCAILITCLIGLLLFKYKHKFKMKNIKIYAYVLFVFCILFFINRFILVYKTEYAAIRYNHAFDYTLLILFMPLIKILYEQKRALIKIGLMIIMFSVIFDFSIFRIFKDPIQYFKNIRSQLRTFEKNKIRTPITKILESQRVYTDFDLKLALESQNVVPAGNTIFLFTSKPFIFNYSRNKIFACDSGAMVSLKPYMPYKKDLEAMLQYFKTIGVDYIIYSKDEIDYSREGMKSRLTEENPLIQWYTKLVFDLLDQMDKLIQTDRVVFSNDLYYVIQLNPSA